MRTKQLHEELVKAVTTAGAVSPSSLLSGQYIGQIADAVFVNERAILEVKSVCDDHAAVAELERRLAPSFERWARQPSP